MLCVSSRPWTKIVEVCQRIGIRFCSRAWSSLSFLQLQRQIRIRLFFRFRVRAGSSQSSGNEHKYDLKHRNKQNIRTLIGACIIRVVLLLYSSSNQNLQSKSSFWQTSTSFESTNKTDSFKCHIIPTSTFKQSKNAYVCNNFIGTLTSWLSDFYACDVILPLCFFFATGLWWNRIEPFQTWCVECIYSRHIYA